MLPAVPAEPLSIAQVTPHRRGTENPVNEFVERRLRGARAARPRGRCVAGTGDPVKKLLGRRRRSTSSTSTSPFAPQRLLGGAAPLLLAQRRHLPRAAGAGALDPGGAAAGRDLLRPPRRPHGGHAGDRGAAGALLPGRLRAGRAGRRRIATGPRSPTSSRRSTGGSPPAATTRRGNPEVRRRIAERPLIEVDLHMHTDHSPRLRDAGRGAARDRPRPRPRRDRDHRPQRGLRGAGGAADRRGDGRHQGDRRRGGEDRRAGRGDRPLPRGEDPEGDDDGGDDRRDPPPGRPRLRAASLRPLPLGARLRAPARHRRGDRHPRGLQPAGGADRLQRGGRALRPQVPDRPRRRLRQPRRPGARQRADADPRLRRARRSSSRRCATPTSPASTRTSSTCRR